MEKFTITLSDGTTLRDLELNGNNFISLDPVADDTFTDNLSPVIISNGERSEEHDQMVLVQNVRHADGRYWFILRDVTLAEIEAAKTRADIEYIAMMTGVEL